VIDITGVTPLPPQKPSTCPSAPSNGQNTPAGFVTSTTSPTPRRSRNQLETSPPATRLTVTVRSASVSGVLDIE
jgi:hypothetical protein